MAYPSWADRIRDQILWAQINLVRNERHVLATIAMLWAKHAATIPATLNSPAAHIRDLNKARRAMTSIEFAGILEAFMGDATVAITSEMGEAAAYLKASAELAITGTNPEAFRFIGFNALPTSAIADVGSIGFLGGSVQKWGSKLPAAILKDMGTTWGIGMAAGWDSDQMARAIAERFGLARASAMRLSRTAVHAAANSAREKVFRANRRLIKAHQYVATLDAATCPECGGYDGNVYAQGDSRPYVPVHPQCRCVYSAVMKSAAELGLGDIQLPAGVRESMDGAVPDTLHYPEWFKQQDAIRQREIITLQFSKKKAAEFDAGTWKPPFWEQEAVAFKDYSPDTKRVLIESELKFREAIKNGG